MFLCFIIIKSCLRSPSNHRYYNGAILYFIGTNTFNYELKRRWQTKSMEYLRFESQNQTQKVEREQTGLKQTKTQYKKNIKTLQKENPDIEMLHYFVVYKVKH